MFSVSFFTVFCFFGFCPLRRGKLILKKVSAFLMSTKIGLKNIYELHA